MASGAANDLAWSTRAARRPIPGVSTMSATAPVALYETMFERGLGEFPMLRHRDGSIYIGFLVKDKHQLVFRDRGLCAGISASQVAPCWDLGIAGAIVDSRDKPWETLSFLGPDLCSIPVDLSATRRRVMGRSVTGAGANVLSFCGSIYRGFETMLASEFLPLVLPMAVETRDGPGLAVTDFRFASVPMDLLFKVHELVRSAVDRQATLRVEEVHVDESEFESLFGRFQPT
jgi:hypothetical protein